MSLAIYKSDDQSLMLMQTKWSSELNPMIKNPSLQSLILKNVSLINGTTIINHLLGKNLTGWRIIRQRAKASIHDTQDANPNPSLTLSLVSDTAVVVDLEVF